MKVKAIFEFPVPIWLMTDVLDTIYPSGFKALRFDVVMPRDTAPAGEPPPGFETVPQSSTAGSDTVEPLTVWTQEYGAFIPESLKPATTVQRVGIVEVDGPIPAHMTWFTPDSQLAEYINPWFDQVRTWVEIHTGQDLDPHHRVYDAEVVGSGLTFIEPDHDSAMSLTIATPSVLPLRAEAWRQILGSVRDGVEPPLEEVLSRDARAAQRRGHERRAILDAATAVEIALGRHVRNLSSTLPTNQSKRITPRSALGDYISIAEHSGLDLAVQVHKLRWLKDLRNDAAHRGEAPNNWHTGAVVQLMMDFLGAHGIMRRTGEREPDGSEWVIAEAEDAPPAT
ncbi:hypothetical protein ABFT23_02165 [Nocardioides sp. C4-1]|uniref:hypothetical protein n=1 Tax=Nocardioides sp. C4-1 TaxID=3151851 RepID=UPI003267113E